MARTRCTDRVVGAILASWRYDISGISPEMRKDYEHHFAECAHCRARQKFHRSLDVSLAVLTSLAVFFFLFALAVLKHIKPLEHVAFKMLGLDIFDMYHMLVSAGIAGRLLLRDCACAGADGHACAVVSGRHRCRARTAARRAPAGGDQVAAAAVSKTCDPESSVPQESRSIAARRSELKGLPDREAFVHSDDAGCAYLA